MSKNPALAGIFQNLEQQQLKATELMDANDYTEAFRVLHLTIQARRQKQNYPILEDLGVWLLLIILEKNHRVRHPHHQPPDA